MAPEAVLFSVVNELLRKLSSPIQNELGLFWGVEKERQKLKMTLSSITAVLQDAEVRQVKDRAVSDWLGKLKAAAYDAEDLFDEFVIEARRREVENQDGMGKKVRNFFTSSNPLAFRLKMAHKMKELVERLDDINKDKERYQLRREYVHAQPLIPSTRETSSYVIESEVYGRDNEKETLIDSLINSGNESVMSIIAIVGMGGLGKTTLAQLVYNDESVVTHFELRRWVYVSENFDLEKVLKEISGSAANGNSIEQLQSSVREKPGGKRYLLVLDDVWNEVQDEFFRNWDRLKTCLTGGAMGSKILVTTRNDQVARIMGALQTHNLEKLSPEDSWSLFEKLVNPEQKRPQKLLSIGKEMVVKCDGLPLAVKTLAGLLSSKNAESDQWEAVKNSEFWKNGGGILPVLRISYDHLPSSLKKCFAYCASIPKGNSFRKHELIKQWIAQGFIINSNEEHGLLEEDGECYFSELVQRSLFQASKETHYLYEGQDDFPEELNVMKHYKMHDLIHELLSSVVGNECFIVKDRKGAVPEESIHFALQNDQWAREPKNLNALKKCKRLRSIFFLGHFVDINVCTSLRCLRVLDLSGSRIRFLPNSIEKLKHLRYLDVTWTSIAELPETICNLHSLQTLMFSYSDILKLPKDMKRMTSLRHIEFEGTRLLLPKGIGGLTCLRTLSGFTICKESEAGIEELKGLNQLQGNIYIQGLENVRNGECADEAKLMEKQYLRSLKLTWSHVETADCTEGNADEVIDNLKPHSDLEKLVVENYTGMRFPSWMMTLTNLVGMKLQGCNRSERLPPLGQLSHLESLEIGQMNSVKYIVEFDGSDHHKDLFRSLRHLVLSEMPNLERWSSQPADGNGDDGGRERDEQVTLCQLRRLKIYKCPKLTHLPRLHLLSALENLEMEGVGCQRIDVPVSKSLKVVELKNMPNLERWSARELDDDEKNVIHPSLKLEVKKCPQMICLPRFIPSLEELKISDSNEMLLGSLANYTSLVKLSIKRFPDVMHLPEELGPNHARLGTLKIRDCPKLTSLSHQLKNLPALEEVTIDGCHELVLSLPKVQEQQQCRGLTSLKRLWRNKSCANQTSLAIYSDGNLESLSSEGLQNLTDLHIGGCPKLWSSPEWLGNFTSLGRLSIGGTDSLLSLPNPLENLKSLKSLKIFSCRNVTSFQEWIGNLLLLETLDIQTCPALSTLPESMGNLKSLTTLSIWDSGMGSIPESVGNLESLNHLWIEGCSSVNSIPESIGNLKSLNHLRIKDCPCVTSIPESIGNLTSLTGLYFTDCPGMRSIPKSVGNLSSLKWLEFKRCTGITTLPKELQRLTNLRRLEIYGCPDLQRGLSKSWKDWIKAARERGVFIWLPDLLWEDEHPSLMQSLKIGCINFIWKVVNCGG